MLKLQAVSKSFSGFSGEVLQNISLSVRRGELLPVLGVSGAGKTTLGRLVSGMLRPDYGTIEILGTEVSGLAPYAREVVAIDQSPQFYPGSVERNVAIKAVKHLPHLWWEVAIGLRGQKLHVLRERVQHSLRKAQVPEALWQREADTNKLSGGEVRRIALASAFAAEPNVIILDEVTTGLDPLVRREVIQEISLVRDTMESAILFMTHDVEAALALTTGRLAFLKEGSVTILERADVDSLRFLGRKALEDSIISYL